MLWNHQVWSVEQNLLKGCYSPPPPPPTPRPSHNPHNKILLLHSWAMLIESSGWSAEQNLPKGYYFLPHPLPPPTTTLFIKPHCTRPGLASQHSQSGAGQQQRDALQNADRQSPKVYTVQRGTQWARPLPGHSGRGSVWWPGLRWWWWCWGSAAARAEWSSSGGARSAPARTCN